METNEKILSLVLSLIKEYRMANILDLVDFVEQKGDEYGLPSMDVINDILSDKTEVLELYFEGHN